jgi:hypothetical protein
MPEITGNFQRKCIDILMCLFGSKYFRKIRMITLMEKIFMRYLQVFAMVVVKYFLGMIGNDFFQVVPVVAG